MRSRSRLCGSVVWPTNPLSYAGKDLSGSNATSRYAVARTAQSVASRALRRLCTISLPRCCVFFNGDVLVDHANSCKCVCFIARTRPHWFIPLDFSRFRYSDRNVILHPATATVAMLLGDSQGLLANAHLFFTTRHCLTRWAGQAKAAGRQCTGRGASWSPVLVGVSLAISTRWQSTTKTAWCFRLSIVLFKHVIKRRPYSPRMGGSDGGKSKLPFANVRLIA